MNKVQILGTMTRDTEIRYTQSGTAIGSFSIAWNDKRKQPDGSYQDVAHFFECTAWGRTAEAINQYFRKGSRILIDGQLDFQQWEKDGQKRSKVGIKVNGFDFIDRKTDDNSNQQSQNAQPTNQNTQIPEIDVNEDEIPF